MLSYYIANITPTFYDLTNEYYFGPLRAYTPTISVDKV